MRFNEKRTCLDFLTKGIGELYINKPTWDIGRKESLKHDIISTFPKANDILDFGQKIQYITKPFYAAFTKSAKKVLECFEEIELSATGTFIMQIDGDLTKTVFYNVHKESNTTAFDAIFYSFVKGWGITSVDFVCQYKQVDQNDESKGVDVQYFIGGEYDKHGIDYKSVIGEWFALIGFLKFCDIETKVLAPKEKFRKMGVRYFNEEKKNIELLDCTWFTNLVISGAFNVSGHLRWQPRKENGVWTKKLIWINEFQKDGYTRKAKIKNEGG